MTYFCFASFQFQQKFKKPKKKKKKNPFPRDFFNEIWLIIGDHEFINIAEIKIWNFSSGGILGAKHFSPNPQMLIYAN